MVARRSTRAFRGPDLGWVLAVLALLVLPVASWHAVTTVHEVCPEHGETLDVSAAPGAHGPSSEAGPRWSAQDPEHGAHDACPFVQLGQPSTGVPEAVLARTRLPETRVEAAFVRRERHAPIPVLLLAPKQSPPV